jgi:hypothetical protein
MVAQAMRERTMNYPIPREAEGLGTPVGEYRRSWLWPLLGWGGSAVILTRLAFPWGISTWWTRLTFGILGLLSLGIMVWRMYRAVTERILIFSAGLVHEKRRTAERYAWADIKLIKGRSVTRENGVFNITLCLECFDGREYEFDESFIRLPKPIQRTGLFQQFSPLEAVSHVDESVRSTLCQTAIKQYASGGAVDFMAFQISQRGIQTNDIALEWSEIADIADQNRELVLFIDNAKTPRLSIPVKEILNSFVFVALLHQIGGKKWTVIAEPEIAAKQPFGKQARRR